MSFPPEFTKAMYNYTMRYINDHLSNYTFDDNDVTWALVDNILSSMGKKEIEYSQCELHDFIVIMGNNSTWAFRTKLFTFQDGLYEMLLASVKDRLPWWDEWLMTKPYLT